MRVRTEGSWNGSKGEELEREREREEDSGECLGIGREEKEVGGGVGRGVFVACVQRRARTRLRSTAYGINPENSNFRRDDFFRHDAYSRVVGRVDETH